MKDASRLIIDEIISGKIRTRKDLERFKHRVCREMGLERFMSNSEILEHATPDEKRVIEGLLRKKPTRTISGVAVVAVMCQPRECPHGRCLYCPESEKAPPSYTGEEPAALRARMYDFHPYRQVYNRLEQLHSIGHPVDKVELIVMGGTFPSHSLCYQEWFISQCLEAMVDFGAEIRGIRVDVPGHHGYVKVEDAQRLNESSPVRCVGMTFETRPDYCREEDVDRMLGLGVTRVELGVQTIYNYIYQRIRRGHSIEDVVESNRILRDSGVKVAMHLMPGLFSDFDRDLRIFRRIFQDPSFRPDMVKIYPCLVIQGSELHSLWERGLYKPYSTEEAVELIVEIKKMMPKWVRTMRIQRDIPSQLIVDGVRKSNLGELVYRRLEDEGVRCRCIRCREVGHMSRRGVMVDEDSVTLMVEDYEATGGREFFISQEDPENDVLVGFLRLRFPSEEAHRPEVHDKTALVRELHVYGSMLPIGERGDAVGQHRGYGEELLARAESIAADNGMEKILVTSGIGAREYYGKFGYRREGPYMAKKL